MARVRLGRRNPRARALLRRHLSKEQELSLVIEGYFDVTGASGAVWRIFDGGRCANVSLLRPGGLRRDPLARRLRIGGRYCAHLSYNYPADDALLAQKLVLETNDAAFLAVAH